LLGIVASAALTQWLAVNERARWNATATSTRWNGPSS
jgi:hypothetical protein